MLYQIEKMNDTDYQQPPTILDIIHWSGCRRAMDGIARKIV